ncbi:MAG TPA: hypothetical protein VFP37_14785 [Steroidobacteraceae bacterium]|nr:hypothetical protein [Steroidobacteraceae bacterium]
MLTRDSMRRVWMGISLSVALLSLHPAYTGLTSWWMPGIAFTVFLGFALEPLLLTWELRRRGEELQITDEGVLRRLPRGDSEYVRWSELREVSIVVTPGANRVEEYFFVLAGPGTTGVLVGQRLASRHDLLSHLNKLPGFDHRGIAAAFASPVNQRFTLWRAAPIEGEAHVLQDRLATPDERSRLRLH